MVRLSVASASRRCPPWREHVNPVDPESCCWDLNPGPLPYQGGALPLSYSSDTRVGGPARQSYAGGRCRPERAMGFEPTTSCLEGRSSTVELHPHRNRPACHSSPSSPSGQGGIRTPVGRKPPDLQSGAIDRSATCPVGSPRREATRWDSNPQPTVYKTGALPLSYA